MQKNTKVIVSGTLSIIILVVIFLVIAKNLIGERFIATLPNDTTVELLGICEYPSTKKQWWRPEGSTINSRSFDDFHFDKSQYVPEFYEQARVFAIRLGGRVPKEMKLTWKVPESIRSTLSAAYIDEDEKLLKPTQTLVVEFPKEVQQTDLVIEIAAGKWKIAAFGDNGGAEVETNDSLTDRPVVFHRPVQQNDTVELSASHSLGFDYDCRVVVVGPGNEVHEPTKRSTSVSDMNFCCKGTFNLSPDQIKNVRLEARPYEGIVFKNVSLRRGYKTDCQIEVVSGVSLLQVLLDKY